MTPARVLTETVTIPVPGAPPTPGFSARPDTAEPLPAVLVGMELFGLSADVRDVCERLASLGYHALAPDLYHRSAPGIELPEDTDGRAHGFELLHQLTRQQTVDDVRAAWSWRDFRLDHAMVAKDRLVSDGLSNALAGCIPLRNGKDPRHAPTPVYGKVHNLPPRTLRKLSR